MEEYMKAVTIRGVDPETADRLKNAAADQGKSVNQLILEFIRKNLGLGIEKEKKYSRIYNDMDGLFGKWSDDEYNRIQNKIDQDVSLIRISGNEKSID